MRRIPFLIALTASLMFVFAGVAQPVPRVPPANDNLIDAVSVLIPDTRTVATMNESTIEPGEPAHQCTTGGPVTGAGSVWYYIHLPGGVLTVDTATSELSTAVSLYPRHFNSSDIAALQAVGCSATGPNGSAQARLKKHVVAGEYYVQVSRIIGLLGSTDVNVAFSFVPDITPKGDNSIAPVPLTIGKVAVSKNIQYALWDASAESAPSCATGAIASSVWFFAVMPFTGSIAASAAGTLVSSATGVGDSVTVTAYGQFIDPAIPVIEKACSADAANSPALLSVFAGDRIWFRLSVGALTNLFRASTYKLNVIYEAGGMISDGGFENGLTFWKLKKALNGDGITTVGGEVLFGSESFKFVGSPTEKTSLSQTITIPATMLLRNTKLTVIVMYMALPVPQDLYYELTLTPRDGSAPVVIKHLRTETAPGTHGTSIEYFAEVEKVSKIKLTFKNKNPSGSLILDNVVLVFNQYSALRDVPAGVLPLPSAP